MTGSPKKPKEHHGKMWNDLLIVEEGVALCRAPLSGYKSEKKKKEITGCDHKKFYVLLLTSFDRTTLLLTVDYFKFYMVYL